MNLPPNRDNHREEEPTPHQLSCLNTLVVHAEPAPTPSERHLCLSIPAGFVHGEDALELLCERLCQWKWVSSRRIDLVTHALHEALNNAILHGCRGKPDLIIELSLWATTTQFEIHITDPGPGFSPHDVQHAFKGRRRHFGKGRGIVIMYGIADVIQFYDGGRTVVLGWRRRDIASDN